MLQLWSRPPAWLLCAPRRQDDDDDEDDDDDDDAMHEECGFVMFCAFSVIFKKKN